MISIIIPTYNELKVLLDCLKSLEKQDYSDFEVILVDDGSIDNTQELASNFKSKKYRLIFLKQNHKGPGAARNLGASKAKGDILVFVDADMTFDKDFLKNLVKPIEQKKAKGTFSKEEYVSNWENVWARCWNINEGWEAKKRHPKNYPSKQKVFRAILKSEFEKVKGFTPGGYNDDWSLSEKLDYEAEIAENAKFYHKNPSSLKEIFLHAKWVGKRQYKFGLLGKIFALVRSSLPISVIIGFYKYIVYGESVFVIFKVIYDFGVFCGILISIFSKNLAK
jgi:Glycosyltransferases, probably involved in cell wall biogenesis